MMENTVFCYIKFDENHNGTLAGFFSFEDGKITIHKDYTGALKHLLPAHETAEHLQRVIKSVNRNGYAIIVPEELASQYIQHDHALTEALAHPFIQAAKPDWTSLYEPSNIAEQPSNIAEQASNIDGHFVTEIPVKIKQSAEHRKLHSTLTPEGQLKLKLLNGGKLIYHPRKGYHLAPGQTISPEKPLVKADMGTKIKLVHYSKKSGLKDIDPQYIGSGVGSKQELNTEVPRTYFYRESAEPEVLVTSGAKSKYTATVDPMVHKLYDLAEDQDKHVESAIKENNGAWNTDMILNKIKGAGYHGFYNSKSAMPDVVALFHSHPVDKEEKL